MIGLDISFSKITPQWIANRKAEGYEVFIQCAWTGGLAGNDGIKAVCEHNLKTAREGGLITCAYVNASPPTWWPLSKQMFHIKENCGSEWTNLQYVFMDVEIVSNGQYVTPDRAIELANAIIAEGKDCDTLYSAKWYWNQLPTGGDPRWHQHFPMLWNAFYDSHPDIDFPASPYGAWQYPGDVVGEQYQNTTQLEGVAVDLNTFVDFYFEEDDMALTARQEQTLEELAKWTLEPYTVTWPDGTLATFPSKLQFLMDHTTAFDQHRIVWIAGKA